MTPRPPAEPPRLAVPTHPLAVGVAYVRLLGHVQLIRADGQALDQPSASQRRLLGLLCLVPGRTMRPEYLSDQLGVSGGALRKTIGRLRDHIGPEQLHTGSGGYRVDCEVDVERFTRSLRDAATALDELTELEGALALWAGNALDEFAHEPWAEAEAARLEELRSVGVERRAELLLENGRVGEAVSALQAHVVLHPTRDRPRGLLLRSLAADGRQVDALRAYQTYRTYLAEEFGTEPSSSIVDIERRIATGFRAVHENESRQPLRREAKPPLSLHRALRGGAFVVGRKGQLAALEADLTDARRGIQRTMTLSGEAGIGKTTLLGAFARSVHERGGTVVYGRCDEGAGVPLQPFHSIVEQLVHAASSDVLRSHVDRFGTTLRQLVPNLAVNDSGLGGPRSATDSKSAFAANEGTSRHYLFESVSDLIQQLADSIRSTDGWPLTIILDDCHWAEPTALLLLRHVLRETTDHAVVLVVSYRDSGEHKHDELRATLSDMDRGSNRRIALVGFDDRELTELTATTVNGFMGEHSGALVAHLVEETGGNPLYASQLVRHLMESGRVALQNDSIQFSGPLAALEIPPSLRDVVWSRVRAIGPNAPGILGAAALLGIEFRDSVLGEILNIPPDDLRAVLDASVDAGLLTEVGETARDLRFTHALVAHALYSELKARERSRLHQRAAAALVRDGEALSQKTIVELARHTALAGQRSEAQRWATMAGDYALDHAAPIEAARWFAVALEHAQATAKPEAELAEQTRRLGEAQHRAGDPRGHSTLLEAAALAKQCGADDVLVDAALADDRERTLFGAVDVERLDLIESALAVCRHDQPDRYARLLSRLARELIHTPRADLRQRVAAEALVLVEHSADPTLIARVAPALLSALWAPDTMDLRRTIATRAAHAADRTLDPFLQFRAQLAAFVVAVESADVAAAGAARSRLDSLADRLNEPRQQWSQALLGVFHATMGARFDEGEALAAKAFELASEIGDHDAFTIYAGQIFVSYTFAGRHAELFPLVEQALHANPDVAGFRIGYGIITAFMGRPDDAQEILDQAVEAGFASVPNDYFWKTTIIGYAILAIELSDVRTAELLYPILEPFGAEVAFNGVTSQGYIGAYLGKLASLLGRHDEADFHLQAALRVAESFGWEYHRATTLVALALSRIRRLGVLDGDAVAWLGEAQELSDRRGLRSVAAQIKVITSRAGQHS